MIKSILLLLGLLAATHAQTRPSHGMDLGDMTQMGQLPSLSSLTQGNILGGVITSCPSCRQANYLQWVRQMMALMVQIREEYYQLISLKELIYANGAGDIDILSELGRGGTQSQYAVLDLMERLQSGNYGLQTLTNSYNQIRLRHQLMGNRLFALSKLLEKQQEQSFNDSHVLEATQQQAKHTLGTHQALQVNNAFQGQNGATLQKIQHINAAHSQLQATYLTTIEDQKARQNEADAQFRGPQPIFTENGDNY